MAVVRVFRRLAASLDHMGESMARQLGPRFSRMAGRLDDTLARASKPIIYPVQFAARELDDTAVAIRRRRVRQHGLSLLETRQSIAKSPHPETRQSMVLLAGSAGVGTLMPASLVLTIPMSLCVVPPVFWRTRGQNPVALDPASGLLGHYERIDHPRYKYRLLEDYTHPQQLHFPIPQTVKIVFSGDVDKGIQLTTDGRLQISAGYCWDGPSGPTIDTRDFMRGSLVHDVLYQILRTTEVNDWGYGRQCADVIIQDICLEDGMPSFRASYVYICLRLFGGSAAKPQSEPQSS